MGKKKGKQSGGGEGRKKGEAEESIGVKMKDLLAMLAATVQGLHFWMAFYFALDSLFFFPLVDMAINGCEAMSALLFLFPLLFLSFSSVFTLVRRYYSIFNLLGLISYLYFYTDAAGKIIYAFFGSSFLLVGLAGGLYSTSRKDRRRVTFGFIIGTIIFTALKVESLSVHPFVERLELLPIFVGVVVGANVITLLLHDRHQPPLPSPTMPMLTAGLYFSAMYFFAVAFGSSANVICRFVDIDVFPNQFFVLGSMIVGALLSSTFIPRSLMWDLLLVVSLSGMLYAEPQLAFASGCVFIGAVTALWPVAADILYAASPISFALGCLGFLAGCFAQVWVVAYNFVPGGWLLRERIDLVLFAFLLCIIATFPRSYLPAMKPSARGIYLFLLVLAVGCVVIPIAQNRFERHEPPMERNRESESGTFTSMIWTTHFGYDNHGWNNFKAALSLIEDAGTPDIIGLLETDTARLFTGNRDMIEYLSENLHYYSAYGPETRKSTWGCAVLSRYPFVHVENLILPSPHGELACMVDAVVNINGTHVNFLVTHFGVWEDKEDRDRQTEATAELVKEKDKDGTHLIFMGYITAPPYRHYNYKKMVDSGLIDSLPQGTALSRRWYSTDRWCQYIFYKNVEMGDFARKSVGHISDTEWQKAWWTLPASVH